MQQQMVDKFDWPKGAREEGFPLEPYEDVVFIEQIEEQTTKSGLIIANTEHAKMQMGRVVAVGPGRLYYAPFNASESLATMVFVPSRLKVGELVSWGRYATGGEPWIIGGKTIIAAREGDLGARVIANADGTLPEIRRKPAE